MTDSTKMDPVVGVCSACGIPFPMRALCPICGRRTVVKSAPVRGQVGAHPERVTVARPAVLLFDPLPSPRRSRKTLRAHGSSWRVRAETAPELSRDSTLYRAGDAGGTFVFDELVVDDWFQLERMDTNVWWARIGDAQVSICLRHGEPPEVSIERNEYGPGSVESTKGGVS